MKRLCSVTGCTSQMRSLGLCNKHWSRQNEGRPLVTWREKFIQDNPPIDGIGKIPLSQEHFAIVDEEDYSRVIKYKWCLLWDTRHVLKYAVRDGSVRMHRFILNAKRHDILDHKNHDGLDNRKGNLRFCTYSQNMMNQRKTRGLSKFKGVCWDNQAEKWKAAIHFKGKHIHLAHCHAEEDAKTFYDVAAQILFGSFAYYANAD